MTKSNSLTLIPEGGTPPYQYTLVSGSGTLSGSSFTPDTGTTLARFSVVDGAGQVSFLDLQVNETMTASKSTDVIAGPTSLGMLLDSAISGGVPPLRFSVTSGNGSIDSVTGIFTMPTMPGNTVVTITDKIGNSVTVSVSHGRNYFNGIVNGVAIDNNEAYFVGDFTGINVSSTPSMAQLSLVDGTVATQDCNYAHRLTGVVYSAVSDGVNLYLGGNISSYDGHVVEKLIKIKLSDCILDQSFSQISGFNETVESIVLDGSSVFVGGSFSTYRGAAATGLAKLDVITGALDTSFTKTTTIGEVKTIAINGSDLYAGGTISNYQGNPVQGLIKVDKTTGNLDTVFTTTSGFTDFSSPGDIQKMLVTNSSLYLVGEFDNYRGTNVQNVAKLNLTTGTLDTTFSQTSGLGFPSRGRDIATDGTSIYIVGEFWNYRGGCCVDLVKLNANTGALDVSFSTASVDGGVGGLNSVFYHNNYVYIGGATSISYRGTPVSNLYRLDSVNGNLDTAFSSAILANDEVYGMSVLTNGNLLAVGGFTSISGIRANGIAKMDLSTGEFDTAFSNSGGFNASAQRIVVSGSALFITGAFTQYRGQAAPRLAKINKSDGSLDTTFTQATGLTNTPNDLHVFSGSLYVGGNISSYRGSTVANVIKLDMTNGNLDTTFSQTTGPNQPVYAMTDNGTSLFIGGSFTTYRGTAARGIAKIDASNGNLDGAFSQNNGVGIFTTVYKVLHNSGSIYISGSFNTYRGTAAQNLAKLDSTNGNLDTTFTQATGLVGGYPHTKQILFDGTNLIVGHENATYRGVAVSKIIALDPSSGQVVSGFSNSVLTSGTSYALTKWNSNLIAVGSFTKISDVVSANFGMVNLVNGNFVTLP